MIEQYVASSFIEFLYSETDKGRGCHPDEDSDFQLTYKEQVESDEGQLTITDWELLLDGNETNPDDLATRFGIEFTATALTKLFIEKNLTHVMHRRDPDGI